MKSVRRLGLGVTIDDIFLLIILRVVINIRRICGCSYSSITLNSISSYPPP